MKKYSMVVKKIMFVCHGNICRSPMAEVIFKDLAKKQGMADRFLVASSATSTEEIWNGIGSPVYPPAKAELERHGLSCDGKRAVQLQKSDYGKYDLFIGMDSANLRDMYRVCGGGFAEKMSLLMDHTEGLHQPDRYGKSPYRCRTCRRCH